MSALSIQVPFPVFQDRDGQPLDNGYVWVGVANLNPQTNPVIAYYDAALTIQAVQPLRTLNGYISRAGTPAQIYIDGVNFSILVQDSKGSMVYNFLEGTWIANAQAVVFTGFKGQVGTVAVLADDDGSDWIGFQQDSTNALPRSAQDKLRETVYVADFGSPTSQAAIQAAMAYAIANNKVVLFDRNSTIRVPTDATTLQIAFDYATPSNVQTQIDVVIETGHQPASGVSVSNGDYSQWQVSSEGAAVTLASSFTGRFINCDNGNAPTLNTYVIGNLGVDRVYSLFGSTGKVNASCGGEGAAGRILYGNAATIQAGNTIWKNYGDSIYFSAGSSVQLGNALLDGATVTVNGALVASRGSAIEAQGIIIKNCWFAVECKRAGSSINMHEGTLDTIGRLGIRASRGASVSFSEGTIVNLAPHATGAALEAYTATIEAGEGVTISYVSAPPIGNYAVRASDGGLINCSTITITLAQVGLYATNGGRIAASSATITNAASFGAQARQGSTINVSDATITGSGLDDLRVTEGAIISASSCTTTNGVGTPNVIDTNLDGLGGLNAFGTSGRGIIFP